MSVGTRTHGARGAHLFAGLARGITRHPWYPILFWVVLLLLTLPFLSRLGSVTTNSTTDLPTNAPSAQASAELARYFPNASGGSSTILLFYGPDLTNRTGQSVVTGVAAAIAADRSLVDVAGVSTVYSQYALYLAGQVRIASGVLAGAESASPSLTSAVNSSAALLWGPPALFLATFESLVAGGTSPANASAPAYATTNASLGNPAASAVLSAFYPEFNVTARCWANLSSLVACTDASARTGEAPLLPVLFPAAAQPVAAATLAGVGVENSTAWSAVQSVAVGLLGPETGTVPAFLRTVWDAFPGLVVGPAAASSYANATVANATLATEPLPVPFGIRASYVNPAGTASIVAVDFTRPDSYTDPSGGQPVYADLNRIDALVPGVVTALDPSGGIAYVQTGPAPLDLLTQTSVDSSIALVLPLTVGLLLAIAMLYFRSPLTPILTFAALGIALVLGLGGTVLIGTLVGHVDTTSITLEEVFVLGVGTDYSIFLVARYREELIHGRSSDEAIAASLSWAGQSVATSGSTAIIATLALAFSGVALLEQWGRVLSLAILVTMLVSLTMVPAFLKLLGPRIFWPTHGERFERHARRVGSRLQNESTYFYRVGRATQRRPRTVVAVLLLVSIPLVAVALTAPLSYDFYAQLPGGHPATQGLAELGVQFGNGFAVPSFALVTFASPLIVGNATNASEFADVGALTDVANATPGIAAVPSLVGPYGAPLADWQNLSHLPAATQANLLGAVSGFVGTDGRTVLIDLVPSSTGLSGEAVTAVQAVEKGFAAYAAGHPAIVATAYGGGAPVIHDLSVQTATATLFLILAVTVGLVVVLLAVLRSAIIALMAVATIGLSIAWAWAVSYLVFDLVLGFPLFFYVQTLLIILVLGLGIDYNIFLLTRVREERLKGRASGDAAVEAVARTGGIITAAAIILASAFAALLVGSFTLIRAIGFSVAVAVILDAMVVRTYLVPASLQLLGERVWSVFGRRRAPGSPPPSAPGAPRPSGAADDGSDAP